MDFLAEITKFDLIFLGSLYVMQSLLIYLGPLIATLDPTLAEILTGITSWPGTADLVANFGVNYTLIIGIFGIVSGIALVKQYGWAWGQAMVVLSFIVIQTLISFIAALISGDVLNIISITNMLILITAISGIAMEKPWNRTGNLDYKIWVAAISYEKVDLDKLAENFQIKSPLLVDRTIELIAKNKIEGQVRFPTFFFNCPENLSRLKAINSKRNPKQIQKTKIKDVAETELNQLEADKSKQKSKPPTNKRPENQSAVRGKSDSETQETSFYRKIETKIKKTISPRLTIASVFLLGFIITYQALILYLLPLLASIDPLVAELLSGVSPPFPTLGELVINYGITYTLIIGMYMLISAFGIKNKKDWALGTLFTVLIFIIFDNGLSFTSALIMESSLELIPFISLLTLFVAIVALAKEKPWTLTRQLDYKLLVASTSYEKINNDELMQLLKVNPKTLFSRLSQLIVEDKIDGKFNSTTTYFDTQTNKMRLMSQKP